MPSERDYPMRRLALAAPGTAALDRRVPIEAPVAIEYNGIGYAVMMATPADLDVYAVGLTIAEGLVERADQIEDIAVVAAGGGWIVRIALPPARIARVAERARARVSESGCGLCGMDNIAAVLAPLPRLAPRIAVESRAIAAALDALAAHQPLGRATGAAHAAAFATPAGAIVRAAEDVGRHNALDKLVGTLARDGIDAADGFFLLSARCSYELVEKTVRAGCPLLVTISAPTSLAVDRACAAGLALVSLARRDSALVACDPHAIVRQSPVQASA